MLTTNEHILIHNGYECEDEQKRLFIKQIVFKDNLYYEISVDTSNFGFLQFNIQLIADDCSSVSDYTIGYCENRDSFNGPKLARIERFLMLTMDAAFKNSIAMKTNWELV